MVVVVVAIVVKRAMMKHQSLSSTVIVTVIVIVIVVAFVVEKQGCVWALLGRNIVLRKETCKSEPKVSPLYLRRNHERNYCNGNTKQIGKQEIWHFLTIGRVADRRTEKDTILIVKFPRPIYPCMLVTPKKTEHHII